MRINFVTETKDQGWILRPISENYSKYIPNSTITSLVPDYKADVNIFVNYRLYKPVRTKTVGYFTHRENVKFDEVAKDVDYCIAMSNKTAKILPKNKTTVIEPCVSPIYTSFDNTNIKIGWVGREYSTNRKRSSWLPTLANIDGVKIYATNGKIEDIDMPYFYRDMDYILITAKNEGGPMPVKEAIAMKKPVIAPVGVGWCDEYPAIRYKTLKDLKNILRKLVIRNTWKKDAQKIMDICNDLFIKH